jgi:N-acetylglucosaminyl-diphospho-decaprenol L-rhamnosyltransferase
MDSATRVLVAIVNYNTGELTRRCLETVARDLADVEWEAVVVDNASADGSAAKLTGIPHVRIIANAKNVGFGAAVNQAARLQAARPQAPSPTTDSSYSPTIDSPSSPTTDSPILFLLNPDCELQPGAFRALVETLDAHPDCAIAAPRLLNADGSVQASARGEPNAWTGLFGRHSLLTKVFPSSSATRRNLPARDLVEAGVESAEIDWAMAAAMLVRRQPFDAVDGFDEQYFLYWEDADLCRRLRDRGWKTRYVPRAIVKHAGGASAATDSGFATREFHKSAYLYYATHIVTSPLNPLRWMAKFALSLRAWWRA